MFSLELGKADHYLFFKKGGDLVMKFVKIIALALAVMCFAGSSTFAMNRENECLDDASQSSVSQPSVSKSKPDLSPMNTDKFVFCGFSYEQLSGIMPKETIKKLYDNGQIVFSGVGFSSHDDYSAYAGEAYKYMVEQEREMFEEQLKK